MILGNQLRWLGHPIFRVAAGHPLHAHQPHMLAVQVELAVLHFQAADSEGRRNLMHGVAVGNE